MSPASATKPTTPSPLDASVRFGTARRITQVRLAGLESGLGSSNSCGEPTDEAHCRGRPRAAPPCRPPVQAVTVARHVRGGPAVRRPAPAGRRTPQTDGQAGSRDGQLASSEPATKPPLSGMLQATLAAATPWVIGVSPQAVARSSAGILNRAPGPRRCRPGAVGRSVPSVATRSPTGPARWRARAALAPNGPA